jgi:hypothetical protein
MFELTRQILRYSSLCKKYRGGSEHASAALIFTTPMIFDVIIQLVKLASPLLDCKRKRGVPYLE